MKYYTKIEWILEHDDFMKCSKSIVDKESNYIKKNGEPIPNKVTWRMVNLNINKKLKNNKYSGGICSCNSGVLCVHRKKYLISAFNGDGSTVKTIKSNKVNKTKGKV